MLWNFYKKNHWKKIHYKLWVKARDWRCFVGCEHSHQPVRGGCLGQLHVPREIIARRIQEICAGPNAGYPRRKDCNENQLTRWNLSKVTTSGRRQNRKVWPWVMRARSQEIWNGCGQERRIHNMDDNQNIQISLSLWSIELSITWFIVGTATDSALTPPAWHAEATCGILHDLSAWLVSAWEGVRAAGAFEALELWDALISRSWSCEKLL